ncbi:MAG: hypothetical protein IPN20_21830 [Haliscomenobacter sp.]|nr:hypothetical protein [Haliscomenobacter sp.]
MENSSNLLSISGSEEFMDELRVFLSETPETEHLISERRNLDGDSATWIAVISVVLSQVPHVLEFIAKTRRPALPTQIKFGDIEIANPSEKDLEMFRALIQKKIEEQPKKG